MLGPITGSTCWYEIADNVTSSSGKRDVVVPLGGFRWAVRTAAIELDKHEF